MGQDLYFGTHLASVARFDVSSPNTGATHSVFVSAPYGHDAGGEEDYPLLIVLDANLLVGTSVEAARLQASTREAQEVIVACVGTAADLEAHSLRRLRDYSPERLDRGREAQDSPVVQMLARRIAAAGLSPEEGAGGAAAFLRFIETELVPTLSRRYRVRDSEIGLAGHSGGGMFASYALLSGSAVFRRFIIGSATGPWLTPMLGELEEGFAGRLCNRELSVFYGVGARELEDPALGPALRSGLEQAERLAKLPGMRVETRVYPDETHASVMPQVLASGLRFHWPGMSYAEMAQSRFA